MSNILSILTTEEKDFIRHHGINPEDIYDGRRETIRVYHDKAKTLGCHFVISQCQYGHRLKTRNGHCIVCKPAQITYQRRETGKGVVYIAKSGRYCKVGMIENNIDSLETALHKREYRLNSEGGYGEILGWKIIKTWSLTRKAGKIEREAQQLLECRKVEKLYWYSGELRTTHELFKCTQKDAEDAVLSALERNQ